MGRAQDMRNAADEELETQKILSNIAKLKATSRWVMTEPEAENNSQMPQDWSSGHATSNGGASAQHKSQHTSKSARAKKASKTSKK